MTNGFRPWVGPNYAEGLDGLRVLVLGESHYVKPEWDFGDEQTIRSIQDNAIGDGKYAFFTKAAKLILGRFDDLPHEVRIDFWNRVAFYNFVQESVGLDPRMRPTAAMWEAAQPRFLEQLEVLKPHCVVVLGKRIWQSLPVASDQRMQPYEMKMYTTGQGTVVASYTNHPSWAGFSYAPVAPRIEALLKEARQAALAGMEK